MNPTLKWLLNQELPDGGIRAWENGPVYPEVTGYSIPTLMKWGERELAFRCAEYLVRTQGKDGSFRGIDGVKRIFDTSACYEGLKYLGFDKEAERAKAWILGQPHDNNQYNIRSYALIGEFDRMRTLKTCDRWHYKGYALEGLLIAGELDLANRLMPEFIKGELVQFHSLLISETGCIPATAQFAMLYKWVGWDNSHLIEAIEKYRLPNGGLPDHEYSKRAISWAAKFYLDAVL